MQHVSPGRQSLPGLPFIFMLTIDPKTITSAQLRRCADILDTITLLGRTFQAVLSGKQPPEQTVHVETPNNVHRGRQWSEARRKKFRKTIAHRNSIIQPVGFDKPTRRKLSAATKAKIAAAARARWAKAKSAGRKSL
jgi:hypothetical protein